MLVVDALPDLTELKAAIVAASEKYGTLKAAEVACGVNRDAFRSVMKGRTKVPKAAIYTALGLEPPLGGVRLHTETTRRLPTAVARFQAEGRPLRVTPLARAAGCSKDAAVRYLTAVGLYQPHEWPSEALTRRGQRAESRAESLLAQHEHERQMLAAEKAKEPERRFAPPKPDAAKAINWRAEVRDHLRRERDLSERARELAAQIEREPELGMRLAGMGELKRLGGMSPNQGVVIDSARVREFWDERRGAAEAEVARLRNLHERVAKVLAPQPCRTHLELMLDVDAALDLSRAALAEPKP